MSRDDVLLVIQKKKNTQYIYYVLHANASWHWCTDEWDTLITPESKYTYSRARALVIAHNKQKKLDTEYGVVEITLPS
jgi:hypothetical protein